MAYYVFLAREDSYASGTATGTTYVKALEEGLKEAVEYWDEETIAHRSMEASYVTKKHAEGPTTWVPTPDNIDLFLLAALGTSTTDGTAGTTTYTDIDTGDTPSMKIGVGRRTSNQATYSGMRVNKWELNHDVGKPLLATWDWLGKEESSTGDSLASPSFAGLTRYSSVDTITIGGASVNIAAFTISGDNGVDLDDDHTITSTTPPGATTQGLVIEGDFTLTAPNGTLYSKYRNGTSTTLYYEATGKTANGTSKTLKISLQDVYIQAADPGNMKARDKNKAEYKFRAAYTTGSSATITITRET